MTSSTGTRPAAMGGASGLWSRYFWLCTLGLSVGWFEAAVVVYLRKLYYPDGFRFPIELASTDVLWVEVVREVASIVLLAAAARLAGAFFLERFAAFMILFGVWDIFYYVFLKAILGWPPYLGTWDVLFLIPVPWIGPVWSPLLVALSLLVVGTYLLWTAGRPRRIMARDWWVECGAGLLVVASWTLDWRVVTEGTLPCQFPWQIFGVGWSVALGWFFYRETKERRRQG